MPVHRFYLCKEPQQQIINLTLSLTGRLYPEIQPLFYFRQFGTIIMKAGAP